MNTFQLDQRVIDKLLEKITQSTSDPREGDLAEGGAFPVNTPSKDQLRGLIRVAFWASLKKEEGQPISFQIVFSPPEESDEPFVFKAPKPFTPDQVAKLAPALDPKEQKIGVWVNQNNGLEIWGFTPFTMSHSIHIGTFEPGQILVTGSGPDVLITGDRFEVLKRISTLPIPGHPQFNQDDIANMTFDFSQKFELSELLDQSKPHSGQIATFSKLANRMWLLKKGGTLLIVPNQSNWQASIDMPIHYSCGSYDFAKKDFEVMREYLEKALENKSTVKILSIFANDGYLKSLNDSLDASLSQIARFTAIDGAALINDSLSVLAFGAKIKAKDSGHIPQSVFVSEFFEGSEINEKQIADLGWGTRHKSAAQFVFDQRESIAIVASQDGKLSIMGWDKQRNSVAVITHAEYAFA
jgi:hypothetical protein